MMQGQKTSLEMQRAPVALGLKYLGLVALMFWSGIRQVLALAVNCWFIAVST